MTESEKRIREMAEIIEKRRLEARVTVGSFNEGAGMWYAKDLYMKGYRKQSEVAKGIRDKIETQGRFEFCGADGKEYLTIRADKLNEIIKAAERERGTLTDEEMREKFKCVIDDLTDALRHLRRSRSAAQRVTRELQGGRGMNEREQQIEEMAYSICDLTEMYDIVKSCSTCGNKGRCKPQGKAEKLYTAGYRKQSDTAKEILQYLYEKMGNVVVSDTELVKYLAAEYGVEVDE